MIIMINITDDAEDSIEKIFKLPLFEKEGYLLVDVMKDSSNEKSLPEYIAPEKSLLQPMVANPPAFELNIEPIYVLKPDGQEVKVTDLLLDNQ